MFLRGFVGHRDSSLTAFCDFTVGLTCLQRRAFDMPVGFFIGRWHSHSRWSPTGWRRRGIARRQQQAAMFTRPGNESAASQLDAAREAVERLDTLLTLRRQHLREM
jgi:transposase InsO family protein